MKKTLFANQVLPIVLTVVVFAVLTAVLWLEILLLNRFTTSDILLTVRWYDVAIGLTIYLKTSIDFAIFIARLMDVNPGWKNRIGIEIGTAVGNAAGTLAILILWTFFKEVRWLLALMILIAALVLFKLAQEGLEHAKVEDDSYPLWFRRMVNAFERLLSKINRFILPVLKYIIPHTSLPNKASASFWGLFTLSFTVPFILGLDDFAGYVPLFSIVNVFGFAIGVFAGHMILNMLLYLSPTHTVRAVKNPVISFLGSVAFVGLGIWGITEVVHMIGS